jgi:hypothetical protein
MRDGKPLCWKGNPNVKGVMILALGSQFEYLRGIFRKLGYIGDDP